MTTPTTATPTQQPNEPAVLTVHEACLTLRISKSMLYDLIRSRQLESIKIGKSRRIPATAIRSFIKQQLREDNV